jgi:hypothetical protein
MSKNQATKENDVALINWNPIWLQTQAVVTRMFGERGTAQSVRRIIFRSPHCSQAGLYMPRGSFHDPNLSFNSSGILIRIRETFDEISAIQTSPDKKYPVSF